MSPEPPAQPPLPLSPHCRRLLDGLGLASADELYADIPPELRWTQSLRLATPLSEAELSARLLELATPNTHLDEAVCFLGGGVYDHYVPAVVDAVAAAVGPQIIGPASPQPLLQLVFELQELFAALTALAAAAAPSADGPGALVQAIRLALAATGRRDVVIARNLNPDYRAIVRTVLAGPPPGVREAGHHGGVVRLDAVERLVDDATACLVVEQPSFFGCLEDLTTLATATHRHGALLIVKVDPLSLGLLAAPGEVGADVAVADAQPLGASPAFGVSTPGLLACRAELAAHLPCWRVEREGETFRPTPGPHPLVRADCAVRPVAYLAAVGREGLRRAASLSAARARAAQQRICSLEGFERRFRAPFFKEFVVESTHEPDDVAEQLMASNILGPLALERLYPDMEGCLLFAATERRTAADIDMLHHALELLDSDDLDRF